MRALIPAIVIGLVLLIAWLADVLYLRSAGHQAMTGEQAARHARLKRMHQRIVGVGVVLYGVYLSTLTGTAMRWVLPGIGVIGGGAAAGAGIGLLTYAVVGAVGVVTGGVGIALGAAAMALIGGGVAAVGAATGGFGYRAVAYPLVTPWLWIPTIVLGIYLILGIGIKRPGGSSS
ncbi:MAG: hypothetical protein I8H67_15675 [Comamonadaceae bacterium]|nr:hypothetical protein [Comamonadaceae bacterium]MBH2042846.1 hypothetical protein [Comamonadaceae bacterium]